MANKLTNDNTMSETQTFKRGCVPDVLSLASVDTGLVVVLLVVVVVVFLVVGIVEKVLIEDLGKRN